jgi:hypothetical protein
VHKVANTLFSKPWATKTFCVVPACVSAVGSPLWTMSAMPFCTVPMPPWLLLGPIVVMLCLATMCRLPTSCPASCPLQHHLFHI